MPQTSTIPSSVLQEGKQLLSVFKNAIAFTLSLTTLDQLSHDAPDYLYLILATLGIIGVITLIQIEVDYYKATLTRVTSVLLGPIKYISFLTSNCLSILTNFLSALVAKYIITFVPDPTDIKEVAYILLLVLSLFWCMLYAIGVDWHEL
jgi:hypothetical protein